MVTIAYYGHITQSLLPACYVVFGALIAGKVLIWGIRQLQRSQQV